MKEISLEEIIKYHLKKYPGMEFQDMLKLIYQGEFGGGHLISDSHISYNRILEEMQTASVAPDDCENVGNQLARIYLGNLAKGFSSMEIAAKILNAFFVQSSAFKKGTITSYKAKLDTLLNMVMNNELASKDMPDWAKDYNLCKNYVNIHAEAGYPMLRHSENYRNHYSPAYRIVLGEYYRYIPILQNVENTLKSKKRCVIAIDGKCGSGKTTLAQIIGSVYNCPIISMDDFFLPQNLRSEKRYAEPGGNVHYERFIEEVIKPLESGADEFSYRVFDCSKMDYRSDKIHINANGLIIIEGTYSHRPEFLRAYDYKILTTIDAKQQKERIISRNGIDGYNMFEKKWIPLENAYFEYFHY